MTARAFPFQRPTLQVFRQRHSFQMPRIAACAISAFMLYRIAFWDFAFQHGVSQTMNQHVPLAIPSPFYSAVSVSRVALALPIPATFLVYPDEVIE
jgi:hypothetical protein